MRIILTELAPQSGNSSLLIAETYLAKTFNLERAGEHMSAYKVTDGKDFRVCAGGAVSEQNSAD